MAQICAKNHNNMDNVTIVLPTFNEAPNITMVLENIALLPHSCGPVSIVIVDDGNDNLAQIVQSWNMSSLMYMRGRSKGLSAAIYDGIQASKTRFVIVMDADLQHPISAVPKIIFALRLNHPLVVMSRFLESDSFDQSRQFWTRRVIAKIARRITHYSNPYLSFSSDPLSGFFGIDKSIVSIPIPSDGFKYLLDIQVHNASVKPFEISYYFHKRHSGQTKLGIKTIYLFCKQLLKYRRYRQYGH